ncbi:hypothetical protein GW952_32315 (plasmid) [Klebsiella michiganensis]|uniref:Uncharacterized protein n=2 Tax=Klebsiella michiganensis TaxID=1134687 RepID=A0A6P1V6Z3_9ENTR|nr:hypothetical protein [Klebsiella michiganensis]QHS50264.1 hypothetical protein GW952_32315 [Klebsiella michiganensis]
MDKQLQRVKELHSLFDKSNKINHLTIDGRRIEPGSESNRYGTAKVFNSQKLTDKQIHNYAQELAGKNKLKQVSPGVFNAKLGDGSSITLRDVSSSKKVTGARWTVDVRGNPDLKNMAMKYSSVEIKFK